MKPVRIRLTTIDDIPQIDRVRQAVEPWHVATLATQRSWFTSVPPEVQGLNLVATIDDWVVGAGGAGLDLYAGVPGAATLTMRVHPEVTRQGIGSALYERFLDHLSGLGAQQVQVYLMDDEASTDFAEHRGFVLGATDRVVMVDPRALPPQPETPPGVQIRPASETGPEPFYRVSDVAARDEPGDVAFAGMPFDDFIERHWSTMDADLSMIAIVDGVPAATTALNANYETGRAMSVGTDALREFRGRGLVKLLKSASLRAAAERGITAAFTSNDEVNAPIRAINAWLGYQDVGATRSAVKKL